MAAYAALVSLLNNIEQIQNHPRLSNSFDEKQMESLLQRLHFFLRFVETHNFYGGSKEKMEKQIAAVVHAAEDVIESHIFLLIRNVYRYNQRKNREDADCSERQIGCEAQAGEVEAESVGNCSRFYLQYVKFNIQLVKVDLQIIIKDMDSLREMAVKFKEESGCKDELPYSSMAASAAAASSIPGKSNMVGFDGYLTQLLDQLTGHQSDRKIIAITGMGGIGKTTLARNAYDSLLAVQRFDVRVWITVSEGYNVREIILEILSCLRISIHKVDEKTDLDLGEHLHKALWGRRYLIVLDDTWSIEVWDELKFFFPNNCNGSRIIVTTRIVEVANDLGSMGLALDFLDDDLSWKLFCENVFLGEDCPSELKESGMKIVKKCKGLPLSIVVIGGLLRNSSRTKDQWETVERDMRSILKTAEDNRCVKILSLSYSHLPPCLKPCFLYLAIFSEDDVISVSSLIKLWVAEGFIKPNKDQSLEEIAEGYIEDLVGRNLIWVHNFRWNGKVKSCCMHDLLRELCITVARKEEFVCATTVLDSPQVIRRRRRHIITPESSATEVYVYRRSLARSLICKGLPALGKHKLLRVLIAEAKLDIFSHINLRFLSCKYVDVPVDYDWFGPYHIPSSISLLWNVQTLIITGSEGVVAPSEIWEMPQLRHLKFKSISLPDPPPSNASSVMHNLHSLGRVVNFKCSKEALDRLPNIKKLHVYYDDFLRGEGAEAWTYYCTQNFVLFNNLESLHIRFGQQLDRYDLLQSLWFPSSLKKLTLQSCRLEWNDMTIIGSLPHLEALILKTSFRGDNWDPVEGEFLSLKYLRIYNCKLICWNADDTHFPVLENLVLERFNVLVEIPSGMGDIPTLKRICLVDCTISATLSAIKILEEQESMGNDSLQVEVNFERKPDLEKFMEQVNLEGLTGVKFQIKGV